MKKSRVYLAVILCALYIVGRKGNSVSAATETTLENCSEVCNSSSHCEDECLGDGDIQPIITCGDYGGGAANGYCDGDTCFYLCDYYASCTTECDQSYGDTITCNDYSGTACYGYCGDGICYDFEIGYCPGDCGSCGDGMCQPWEANSESPYYCEEDCGPPPDPGPACDPGASCGPGDVPRICNSQGQCKDASICDGDWGLCFTADDCCGASQACYGEPSDIVCYTDYMGHRVCYQLSPGFCLPDSL